MGDESEDFLRGAAKVAEHCRRGVWDLTHWSAMIWGDIGRADITGNFVYMYGRCYSRCSCTNYGSPPPLEAALVGGIGRCIWRGGMNVGVFNAAQPGSRRRETLRCPLVRREVRSVCRQKTCPSSPHRPQAARAPAAAGQKAVTLAFSVTWRHIRPEVSQMTTTFD